MLLTIGLWVLSIIISILISRHYANIQMKNNSISHILIKTYDIGKGLKDVFPDFNVTYNNDKLDKYVRIYEGQFINIGNKDIQGIDNMVEFTMAFPDNCTVKAVKVLQSSKSLKVKHSIGVKTNEVQFVVEKLFKTNDCFRYTAIVESPNYISDSSDCLSFDHMIPNTNILNGDQHIEASQQHIEKVSLWAQNITIISILVLLFLEYFLGKQYPLLRIGAPIVFVVFILFMIGLFIYDYNRMRSIVSKKKGRVNN